MNESCKNVVMATMYAQSDTAGWLTDSQYRATVDEYGLDTLEEANLLLNDDPDYILSKNAGGYYISQKGG